MASQDEILKAVAIVREFAGNPDSGVVADLLRDLETSTPAKEVRVVETKETR
jgi:hypothetical protein